MPHPVISSKAVTGVASHCLNVLAIFAMFTGNQAQYVAPPTTIYSHAQDIVCYTTGHQLNCKARSPNIALRAIPSYNYYYVS